MTSLIEPSFLRRLRALRHHLLSQARSGGAADQVARRRGTSSEFREHRSYLWGDDLRRIDWMAFARTGEPVIKLFHAEEDTVVRLLLDASASLAFGSPPKIEVARQMAAALAFLALAGSRRVQVLVSSGAAEHQQRLAVSAAQRGERSFTRICEELASVEPRGSVSLSQAVDSAIQRFSRPGLLVVLSDFFDSGPTLDALRRARAAGHDVTLVQILDPTELDPTFEGDLTLQDCETGEQLEMTLDTAALEAYAQNLATLLRSLRGWARSYGGCYVRLGTTDDLEGAVSRVLARSVD